MRDLDLCFYELSGVPFSDVFFLCVYGRTTRRRGVSRAPMFNTTTGHDQDHGHDPRDQDLFFA